MDFFQFMVISLHITKALSKRKYTSSSSDEESIENLLYYKDCQHRRSQTTTTGAPEHLKLSGPVRENPCPYPKMCCSMSCDDTCNSGMGFGNGMRMGNGMGMGNGMDNGMGNGNDMNSMMPRQEMMQPYMPSMNPTPRQPHLFSPGMKPRGRKKSLQPTDLLPPIGGRRDFGFTKEKIKSLISEDGDIRKILKDLVRVTMQKVDLLDMINAKRNNGSGDGEDEHEQLYKNDDELE